MSARAEITPTNEVVAAALEQVLRPTLAQISRDLGEDLAAAVFVMQADTESARIELDNSKRKSTKNGIIRLRFRETFKPSRLIMHAEAIFDEPRSANGFSGFTLRGEVVVEPKLVAARKSLTIRYNVWEWTGWQ